MKHAKRILITLLASAASAGIAGAADYEPPVVIDQAPEVVPVEVGSGWYLRGDIGYAVANESDTVTYRTFDAATGTYGSGEMQGEIGEDFSYGLGFGYHFNDLVRADFTVDGMASRFEGESFSAAPCTPLLPGTSCRSEDAADMSAISLMLNGYVDLGTVAGFTPYVGAGAGYTYVRWDDLNSNYYCVGAACGTSFVGTSQNPGTSDWRFTWQAMAGVAYEVSRNLKLDVGYRFREISGGDMFEWDAGTAAAGATGMQGHDGDLQQHEVRIGLRYDLW